VSENKNTTNEQELTVTNSKVFRKETSSSSEDHPPEEDKVDPSELTVIQETNSKHTKTMKGSSSDAFELGTQRRNTSNISHVKAISFKPSDSQLAEPEFTGQSPFNQTSKEDPDSTLNVENFVDQVNFMQIKFPQNSYEQ